MCVCVCVCVRMCVRMCVCPQSVYVHCSLSLTHYFSLTVNPFTLLAHSCVSAVIVCVSTVSVVCVRCQCCVCPLSVLCVHCLYMSTVYFQSYTISLAHRQRLHCAVPPFEGIFTSYTVVVLEGIRGYTAYTNLRVFFDSVYSPQ